MAQVRLGAPSHSRFSFPLPLLVLMAPILVKAVLNDDNVVYNELPPSCLRPTTAVSGER